MTRLSTLIVAVGTTSSVSAQVLVGDSGASAVAASSAKATATVSATSTATASQQATTAVTSAPIAPAPQSVQSGGVSSVVSIYFPGADPLPYVASLIGQADGAQTLAISCGPGVNSAACGFPSSVTVTAGPSTAYVSVSNGEATFIYDCKITGSTAAVCAETFNGNAAYIETMSTASNPGSTSSVTTETLQSTDITWMPITITAGSNVVAPSTAATATPVSPVATGSQASQSSYPDGGAAWAALSSLGGSSPASPSSASGSSGGSASGWGAGSSPAAASASTPATASTPVAAASSASGGLWPSTYTGAATKIGAFANYAAGFVALVGMAL